VDFIAKQQKKDGTKVKITCAVTIGVREKGGFGLAVKMKVEDKSLPQSDLEALVKQAHENVCPYSHATRGNVNVEFEVIGG
jgi:organic hydroperoxide reductase OsmC/OhrA